LADLLTYRIKAAMADAWEMDWLGIAGVIQRLITDERVVYRCGVQALV
jgi:hypothetical protein